MEAVVGIDFTTCAVEVSHRPFGGLFGVCRSWIFEEDCAGVVFVFVEALEFRDRGCLIEPFERGCGWRWLETFESLGSGSLFEAFELGCRRSRGDCGGGLDGWCAFDGWGGAEPVVVIFDLEGFTSDPRQGTDQRYCKKEILWRKKPNWSSASDPIGAACRSARGLRLQRWEAIV